MKRVVRVDFVIDPETLGVEDSDESATKVVSQSLSVLDKVQHEIVSVEGLSDTTVTNRCVNCDSPVPDYALRLRVQEGPDPKSGEYETLWERPICPECETSGQASLLTYVRYALA